MLFIILVFIGIAKPSRRLLGNFDSDEIVKSNRRRTKVRLSDFDFVDADDVGLDKVRWDKPHRKPKVSWLPKQHHRRHEEWRVAEGPMKVAKHESYRQKEKKRRSRARSDGGESDAKKDKEDDKKEDSKTEQKNQSEDQSQSGGDKENGKQEEQKEDPESGDNILKKVKEKSQQEQEQKEPAKESSKDQGGDSLSEQKKKVQAKLDGIVKEKKEKEEKCDAMCEKNANTVECLQCKLSTELLRLNQEQTQCSLKCLVEENVKSCKEGCFKIKAKSLYVVMEDYLKKKKQLMEKKCQGLCLKTGHTGDIYNCWKCRMAEEMTRVARCRHKCQHKVKKDQKGDCFPACLEAVQANMKKLMDEDKERQSSGKEGSKVKGKDDTENKGKDETEKKEPDSKKETAQTESKEKGKDADTSKGSKSRNGNDGW